MTKKDTYILIIMVFCSLIVMEPTANAQFLPYFKYGVGSSPQTLDPAYAWDSASIAILDQVMEGLVGYDLSDPELSIIPVLATDLGNWSMDLLNLTFNLRPDVTFHDGTPFNATRVKYTFDRLTNLILLDETQIAELYKPLAQLYPTTPLVINNTEVLGEYSVKFVLNYPFAAFTALLCFSGSYIVHLNMPFDRGILLNESLIGTGPFVLESYTTEETTFSAYRDYYRDEADIEGMIWILYNDEVAKQQALLAGDIHMVDRILLYYSEEYEANQILTIHPPQPLTKILYIAMNNKVIDKTMRQVISYAIDYETIRSSIFIDSVVRLTSPIPLGIKFHDPTVGGASVDLLRARQILIDANLSHGLSDPSDFNWYYLIEQDPIAVFNFTYKTGSPIHADIGNWIQNDLRAVGIRVNLVGISWSYLPWSDESDITQLCVGEWDTVYNDPFNYINPLFSNTSDSNLAQVDDPWIQDAMMSALTIPNEDTRRSIYSEIQHYIVEDLMPWVFLYQSTSRTCHNKGLTNIPTNTFNKIYFYPCSWSSGHPANVDTSSGTETQLEFPGEFLIVLGGVGAVIVGIVLYLCSTRVELIKRKR